MASRFRSSSPRGPPQDQGPWELKHSRGRSPAPKSKGLPMPPHQRKTVSRLLLAPQPRAAGDHLVVRPPARPHPGGPQRRARRRHQPGPAPRSELLERAPLHRTGGDALPPSQAVSGANEQAEILCICGCVCVCVCVALSLCECASLCMFVCVHA